MTTIINMPNLSNERAKQEVITRLSPPHNLLASTIAYSTQGHLLIMGSEKAIRTAALQLSSMQSTTLLVTEAAQIDIDTADESEAIESLIASTKNDTVFYNKLLSVTGYLGQFDVDVSITAQEETSISRIPLAKLALGLPHFDLILDLNASPILTTNLLPPGYFHANDTTTLASLYEQLPQYIGDFEKPKYFQINNDMCAHSARGQTGCTRCLDVCPADAITSIQNIISIDPHLCHGAGGCSSACPTGAITYNLPPRGQLLDYIQRLITLYSAEGGEDFCLLFHDHDKGRELTLKHASSIKGHIIPIEVEELASVGLEVWLASYAMGVNTLYLLNTDAIPSSMQNLVEEQISLAHRIMTGLAIHPDRLQLVDDITLLENPLPLQPSLPSVAPAPSFTTDKRETLFNAIANLADAASTTEPQQCLNPVIPLPHGAPFGRVTIQEQECTLCLSCVAVCPVSALTAGKDSPALYFTEQNCVQCGLCERSCPEKVITLTPQLRLHATDQPQELIAEEAFQCISCATPFAPKRTVEKMIKSLSEHKQFQGSAINRLKMCADCRVRDIYNDLTLHPEKQLEL